MMFTQYSPKVHRFWLKVINYFCLSESMVGYIFFFFPFGQTNEKEGNKLNSIHSHPEMRTDIVLIHTLLCELQMDMNSKPGV